ncbi:helix-turn-helix transcriptional regulator [Microbacterium sp. cx-59]|nr:helix-turn-helix transcriptional regulator [Microbacterium sp. cx-59]MCC4908393.1 helix-turn-helix transcriptional regulator [Microbacterium sp. cx-59]
MVDLLHIQKMVCFSNTVTLLYFLDTNRAVDVKLQSPSDLARLVKNARAQRSLTQQEVADAVGITRQSLARVERGHGGVSFDTVLLILDQLDIHLEATPKRRILTPAAATTTNAAQAAAAALVKRINPSISSGALDALNKQILPQIGPALLPKFDTSSIMKQIEAHLDSAALASILKATRGLTESLTLPGSVLYSAPRAVEVGAEPAKKIEPDAESNTAGHTE